MAGRDPVWTVLPDRPFRFREKESSGMRATWSLTWRISRRSGP